MLKTRSPSTIAVFAFVFFCLFWFLDPVALVHSPSPHGSMAVKHLVLVQFKADTSAEVVKEVRHRCLVPRCCDELAMKTNLGIHSRLLRASWAWKMAASIPRRRNSISSPLPVARITPMKGHRYGQGLHIQLAIANQPDSKASLTLLF